MTTLTDKTNFSLLDLSPSQLSAISDKCDIQKSVYEDTCKLVEDKQLLIVKLNEKKQNIPSECIEYEKELVKFLQAFDKHLFENSKRDKIISTNKELICKINKGYKAITDISLFVHPKVKILEDINNSLIEQNQLIEELKLKINFLKKTILQCKTFISSCDSLITKEKKELKILKTNLKENQDEFDTIRKLLLIITWMPFYIEYFKQNPFTIDFDVMSNILMEEKFVESCNKDYLCYLIDSDLRPSEFHWRYKTDHYTLLDIDVFNIKSTSFENLFSYQIKEVSHTEYTQYAIDNGLDENIYSDEDLFIECNKHRQEYLLENHYVEAEDLEHIDRIDYEECYGWDINETRCGCGWKFYWIKDGFNPADSSFTIKSNEPFGYATSKI
jgi:hypothetical protein